MLSGSGCLVSALQRYRCRLCRSSYAIKFIGKTQIIVCHVLNHHLFFLTHASWSLQGTPDVRRYGPRWLTYV